MNWQPIVDRAAKIVVAAGANPPSATELWSRLVKEGRLSPTSYRLFASNLVARRKAGLWTFDLPNDRVKRAGWAERLDHAAEIVESYDTPVTLRQLFYRLVADGSIQNTRSAYGDLSKHTTRAREEGTFPQLLDTTREIHQVGYDTGVSGAIENAAQAYRLDRTKGQERAIYICVEKQTLVEQLKAWFDGYGVRIIAFRGNASQTLRQNLQDDIESDGRDPVLIYAGDYDPSGLNIPQVVEEKIGYPIQRIAINRAQIAEYKLAPLKAKVRDPLYGRMLATEGKAVQVELEALDPNTLRALYTKEFKRWFDHAAYQQVLKEEAEGRAELEAIAEEHAA